MRKGIVFEGPTLLGATTYADSYLGNLGVQASSCAELGNEQYTGMSPLRNLAHSFMSKVLQGAYGVDGDKLAALERFAAAYLADTQVGTAGFNRALASVGFRASDGSQLTLERLQRDLCRAIKE